MNDSLDSKHRRGNECCRQVMIGVVEVATSASKSVADECCCGLSSGSCRCHGWVGQSGYGKTIWTRARRFAQLAAKRPFGRLAPACLPLLRGAFSLTFRWVCPACGFEHEDAALRRFNTAQTQAVRLMRDPSWWERVEREAGPPAAA